MTSANTTGELQRLFKAFLADDAKFQAGNASAGTRARKTLGEIAKLMKVRRAEIQDAKNSIAEAKLKESMKDEDGEG